MVVWRELQTILVGDVSISCNGYSFIMTWSCSVWICKEAGARAVGLVFVVLGGTELI